MGHGSIGFVFRRGDSIVGDSRSDIVSGRAEEFVGDAAIPPFVDRVFDSRHSLKGKHRVGGSRAAEFVAVIAEDTAQSAADISREVMAQGPGMDDVYHHGKFG